MPDPAIQPHDSQTRVPNNTMQSHNYLQKNKCRQWSNNDVIVHFHYQHVKGHVLFYPMKLPPKPLFYSQKEPYLQQYPYRPYCQLPSCSLMPR